MMAPIRFRGWISCRRDGEGPMGLVLLGATMDRPGEVVQLAFAAAAPADFPDALEDVVVEDLGARRYEISSGARQWTIDGTAHVHREVGHAFSKAVPPRAVPWPKRALWRAALTLASNGMVQRLLLGRRERPPSDY